MIGFAWDAVAVACITGGLGFAGVLVTVRGARRTSTKQHEEQTVHLLSIREQQADLSNKVESLSENQNVLFQMVVDVDAKVTSVADKRSSRKPRLEVVDV
jgi:hypothetical protein